MPAARKMVRLSASRSLFILAIAILGWILGDLFGPWHSDLTKFNPHAVAVLETEMWRSYYDRQRFKMGLRLVRLLKEQNGFPPFRAIFTAYHASRAAFLFKEGKDRVGYERALPSLWRYFDALCTTGRLACGKARIARLAREELEWWIIHRERGTAGEDALVRALALVTADFYGKDPAQFIEYAKPRARAMLFRSQKATEGSVTDTDWQEVQSLLSKSYVALSVALNRV